LIHDKIIEKLASVVMGAASDDDDDVEENEGEDDI
jgi:hypothetical protein